MYIKLIKHIYTYFCLQEVLVVPGPHGAPHHLHPQEDLEVHYRSSLALQGPPFPLDNQWVHVDQE